MLFRVINLELFYVSPDKLVFANDHYWPVEAVKNLFLESSLKVLEVGKVNKLQSVKSIGHLLKLSVQLLAVHSLESPNNHMMRMLFPEWQQLFFIFDLLYLIFVGDLPDKLDELHVVNGGVIDVWIVFFPIKVISEEGYITWWRRVRGTWWSWGPSWDLLAARARWGRSWSSPWWPLRVRRLSWALSPSTGTPRSPSLKMITLIIIVYTVRCQWGSHSAPGRLARSPQSCCPVRSCTDRSPLLGWNERALRLTVIH